MATFLAAGGGTETSVESTAFKVAVFDIRAKTGIEQESADVFADLVQARIRADLGYDVIGTADVEAMLGMEQLKQAMSCEDSSCLAQIGGALGVDGLVTGSLARLGDYLVISLKYIDPTQARVLGQATRQLQDASESALVETVGPLVRELFADELGGRGADEHASDESAPAAGHRFQIGVSGGFAIEARFNDQGLQGGVWLEPAQRLQLEALWQATSEYFWLLARVWLLEVGPLRVGGAGSVQFDTADFKGLGLGLAADVGTWVGPVRMGVRLDVGLLYDDWVETIVFPTGVLGTLGVGF